MEWWYEDAFSGCCVFAGHVVFARYGCCPTAGGQAEAAPGPAIAFEADHQRSDIASSALDRRFDFDAAAGSSDVEIQFGQYDNFPWSNDGRAFDNIRVEIVTGPVPDAQEDDDVPTDAVMIVTDGTPRTHSIHEVSDIDWVVPHQANARILDATARKLGLPPEKVIVTVDQHANTSAASIPLALAEAAGDNRLKPGQLIILEAMGGGFTWGASVLRW